MTRGRLITLVATVAAIALVIVGMHQPWWRATIAVVVAVVLFRLGLLMVSGLAQIPPEPPDPGTLRKVKLLYRCEQCGTEVRMTVAPDEDPIPPRHCMEDMTLITPIE